jgi:hypothetical protein
MSAPGEPEFNFLVDGNTWASDREGVLEAARQLAAERGMVAAGEPDQVWVTLVWWQPEAGVPSPDLDAEPSARVAVH